MIKKDDDLIIVSKDFTNLRYGYFKSAEILLFYRILLAGKNLKKDNNVIIEDFSIVQKDLEIKAKDLKEEIFAIQDNFLRTKIKYADRNGVGTIALFEGIYNNIKDNTIEAILTSRGKEFLQNLSDGYIRFLFSDVLKFKSKYSRLILPHLMNVSHLKKFIVGKEKLLEIFEIEEKDGYNNLSNFNRVVLKAVETDLKDIFEDFEIEKKKEGRTIKSYIFKWSNDFNFKKDFEKEKVIIEAEAEEETDEEEIKKFIKEKIQTLNYKSIQEAIKKRLESGETKEEIISFIKRNWHRAVENDNYKNKVAILIKAIKEKFELNLTKEEIQKEKNKLNGKGVLEKEVKFVKSDWGESPKKEEAKEEVKKEVTVTEDVKEIENINYKKYLDIKKEKLIAFSNVTDTTKKNEIYLKSQEVAFRISFTRKYTVTLTKKEFDKEIKDLAEIFYKNNIKETTELYKNFFIIIKEEEVKEEVAVAVADVKKENAEVEKVIVETDEEKINQYLEFKEWEEEINKLPSMYDLTEVHYKLFMFQKYMEERKLCENDEEYSEVQEKIWQLEDEKDRLNKKLEEEKNKLWNRRFSKQAKERLKNIKTVKTEKLDF